MLSKIERKYLSQKHNLSKSYEYVLEHRIKKKLEDFYRLDSH